MFVQEKRDLSRVTATERAAQGAYRQAGKTPADVDVVELHDCFTIAEIVATEGLGFFEPGTGGLAPEKGWTSLGGNLPVNPSRGLQPNGHPIRPTGAAPVAAGGASDARPQPAGAARPAAGLPRPARVVALPFDPLKAGLPARFRPLEIAGRTMIGFGPA